MPGQHLPAERGAGADQNRQLPRGELRGAVRGDKGTPLGGIHTGGREILGDQGGQREIQAVQPLGYPVCHEEGNGRASERNLSRKLVPGGRRGVSHPGLPDEGPGHGGAGQHGGVPAQEGIPQAGGPGAHRGEPGGGHDQADSLERGAGACGPFLRQRHHPHRGGHDGGEHRAGDGEGLHGGGLAAYRRQGPVAGCPGGGRGPGEPGDRDGHTGVRHR